MQQATSSQTVLRQLHSREKTIKKCNNTSPNRPHEWRTDIKIATHLNPSLVPQDGTGLSHSSGDGSFYKLTRHGGYGK
jgi:hypothetical protein